MLPSLDDYLNARNLRDLLILSRDIDDQRILQSHWTRDTIGPTKPKEVISGAAFPSWLTRCKKLRYHLIPSRDTDDQKILQSDLMMRGTTYKPNQHQQMLPSSDDFHLMQKFKRLLFLSEIFDQRILQSDWIRGRTGQT